MAILAGRGALGATAEQGRLSQLRSRPIQVPMEQTSWHPLRRRQLSSAARGAKEDWDQAVQEIRPEDRKPSGAYRILRQAWLGPCCQQAGRLAPALAMRRNYSAGRPAADRADRSLGSGSPERRAPERRRPAAFPVRCRSEWLRRKAALSCQAAAGQNGPV